MNIKVAAFTESEKSSNIEMELSMIGLCTLCCSFPRDDPVKFDLFGNMKFASLEENLGEGLCFLLYPILLSLSLSLSLSLCLGES